MEGKDGYVVDFKTYMPMDGETDLPRDFLWKKIRKGYKYGRQAAYQVAGLNSQGIFPKDYYWVVQEKVPPYVVCVLRANADAMKFSMEDPILTEGTLNFQQALNRIKPCIVNNDFYAYPDIIDIKDLLER